MIADALQRYAEELYEEIGGGLCICQRADVSHWCETCQRRIGRIREVLATVREEPQELVIAGTCGRYNAPHHCANCGNSFTALTAEGRAPEPPKGDSMVSVEYPNKADGRMKLGASIESPSDGSAVEARVPHEPPAVSEPLRDWLIWDDRSDSPDCEAPMIADALQRQLLELVVKFHESPDGEGEYGCPDAGALRRGEFAEPSCPGVQKLYRLALAVLANVREEPQELPIHLCQRCEQPAYVGLACLACGAADVK